MSMLAHIVSQNLVSQKDTKSIIYSLCRLNSWEIRNDIGENRTVAFTIPGQSCTAVLLPSLQAAFPCERHVFIYDGCINSTARGLRMSNTHSALIPISQISSLSSITTLLGSFSFQQANIIESWFSSVDAFLKLKHNEKKTGYTPFVCRLGFLLSQIGQLGNGKVDQSQLALTNVLQYMTGSKSRSLKDEVITEARKILGQIREDDMKAADQYTGILSAIEKENIENCAFAHKGILIENKTLMDTVQPKVEWSLKAAKKLTSCACCMPGQGEEEDEEEDDDEKSVSGSPQRTESSDGKETKSKVISKAPVYVDGKTMFAFDPARFT
jgi:hypothetical protein